MSCKCRKCSRSYDKDRAGAEFAGYCSQSCLDQMAMVIGFSQKKFTAVVDRVGIVAAFPDSKYMAFMRHRAIGSVEK